MPLPPYYLEVILVSGVASLEAVMMNGRGGLQVLFATTLRLLLLLTPRQAKVTIQPGYLGKVVGAPSNRSTQTSQEVNTTSQEGTPPPP